MPKTIKCRHRQYHGDTEYEPWDRAPPFALNPRGLLVHRVRYVVGIKPAWRGDLSHYHVGYECGNGCNVDTELIYDVLHANPPAGRLLCEFCEFKATSEGQKSADQLAGRHIHRGRLRVFQTCCQSHGRN